ncbi:MAG: hypothetical protein ABGY71_08050 [bacterium]
MPQKNRQAWLGPLISMIGLATYFTISVQIPALRDSALVNLALVLLGVALSVMGAKRSWQPGRSGWARTGAALGFMLSGFCALLLFFYVFAVSSWMPAPAEQTLALERLPEVTLIDQHGEPVSINERHGRKLVLSFYRGHW